MARALPRKRPRLRTAFPVATQRRRMVPQNAARATAPSATRVRPWPAPTTAARRTAATIPSLSFSSMPAAAATPRTAIPICHRRASGRATHRMANSVTGTMMKSPGSIRATAEAPTT